MRAFLIVFFLFAGILVKAQHNHFIYLQTDNKQPFYVKVKGNVYSSSASGYLIIPKLAAGTHELSIGFPKNQWPSQTIPVTISGKDLGYLLKNFESKGWGLFNIQTMDVIMSSSNPPSNTAAAVKTETKTDEFSNALADVVNTPSIKEIKKEAPKEEKKLEPAKKEETVAVVPVVNKEETTTVPVKVVETPKTEPVKKASVVKKIRSTQTGEASNITYLVLDENGSDTVDIIIPLEKAVEVAVKEEPKETKPVQESKKKEVAKAGEPKFIDIDLPSAGNKGTEHKENAPVTKKGEPVKATNEPITVAAPSITMINSDCKTVATEDDFLKARKKMTAQKSDDEMLNTAKKLFKQKCYSTAQVKNLSVLFLKDEGKYRFFDAVYPFVYDSREFKQLESQLSEEYYISRFRSMIRN